MKKDAENLIQTRLNELAGLAYKEASLPTRCTYVQQMLQLDPKLLNVAHERSRAVIRLCILGEAPDGTKIPNIMSEEGKTFKEYGKRLNLSGTATEFNIRRGIGSILNFVRHELPLFKSAAEILKRGQKETWLSKRQFLIAKLCLLGRTPEDEKVPPIMDRDRLPYEEYAAILGTRSGSMSIALNNAARILCPH
jgi:hypothetical protein